MDLQSMKSVSESLNKGIVSICNICKSLMNAQVNPITDTCSNYKQIRGHIEDAEKCMKTTEKMIKEKLVHLDARMEQLCEEMQNAVEQQNEKSRIMDQLHKEKWSAEVALEYSKAALTQAIKNLESANYALRAQEDRRNAGEGLTIAGGVLLAIPIIGWIAGSIMLSKGVQELNEALNAIRAAEHEQQAFQSQVTEWSAKVYGYQEEIQTTQNEMEKTNEALKRIGVEIKEVHKHLEDTGNIQNMVRRSVFFLNILSGRVTALERQTQHSISWQPVVKVIEEVMKAIVNIAENRLLYSDGAPGLINTLRENVGGLLALCNSPSNSEDDSYY